MWCCMKSPDAKSGSDPRLPAEFIEELHDKLAAVTSAVELLEAFVTQKATMLGQLPCSICSKEGCSEPCEMLDSFLPRKHAGKIHGERTIDISLDEVRAHNGFFDDLADENMGTYDRGKLKSIQEVRGYDFFWRYEACWRLFSRKQQQVLALYHRDGKTIAQIATELGKAPSTIWGRLNRAETRMGRYYQKRISEKAHE